MNSSVQIIPLTNLMMAFIPVLAVVGVIFAWSLNTKYTVYAIARMLGQLLLVGYFLTTIFETDSSIVIIAILAVMVFSSSWIALGTVRVQRKKLYVRALCSIALGGGYFSFVCHPGSIAP